MLEDLKSGRANAVVAWHPDRLHRRPVELEPFIDVIEAAGAVVKTCTAGELDLGTPSGRMVARMFGAAARHEVEHAIERMRSKQAQLRAGGCRTAGRARSGTRRGGGGSAVRGRGVAGRCGRGAGQADPTGIAKEWNGRGCAPRPARAGCARVCVGC